MQLIDAFLAPSLADVVTVSSNNVSSILYMLCSEDDIEDIHKVSARKLPDLKKFACNCFHISFIMSYYCFLGLQEVSVLAKCASPNITEYFASIMLPGTTELLIIMELMATSVSDLVSLSLQQCACLCILHEALP